LSHAEPGKPGKFFGTPATLFSTLRIVRNDGTQVVGFTLNTPRAAFAVRAVTVQS
jgi:hypothetical protein